MKFLHRRWLGIWFLVLVGLAAACDDNVAGPTPTPLAAPVTPTSFFQGYGGPMIGSLNDPSEDQANCTAESGCSLGASVRVAAAEESLPLTPQTFADFGVTLGIPAGYNPLVLSDEILVTALAATTEGGYAFSLRPVTEATQLTRWLERFDNPNLSTGQTLDSSAWAGHWLKTGADSAIAVLAQGERQIFIEAFSNTGFWPAFEATFLAMLTSIH